MLHSGSFGEASGSFGLGQVEGKEDGYYDDLYKHVFGYRYRFNESNPYNLLFIKSSHLTV